MVMIGRYDMSRERWVTDLSAQPGAKKRPHAVAKREGLSLNLGCGGGGGVMGGLVFFIFIFSLYEMTNSERMEIMKPSSTKSSNRLLCSMADLDFPLAGR